MDVSESKGENSPPTLPSTYDVFRFKLSKSRPAKLVKSYSSPEIELEVRQTDVPYKIWKNQKECLIFHLAFLKSIF